MSSGNRRKNNRKEADRSGLTLGEVTPLTDTQDLVFDAYNEGKHLCLHGYAGTGKTFLALYLALKDYHEGKVKRIVIYRSPLATRNIGFLPGTEDEKMAVFEDPYRAIVTDLYKRGDAYDILKKAGAIVFRTTSFARGTTQDDAVIILDEMQNGNLHEISSIITRVGVDTRLILAGDFRQSDLRFDDDKEGVHKVLNRLKKMEEVALLEFKIEDIVRSDFVKSWILSEFDDIK
jgi:phosphate starvation-inducible PhoH-like protein